ncbi:MAG: sugar phosphate isomerase/epimerase [Verrucomicrobia bacterium]|nr:sugar phosphate isomerase/epimerase [Verrucomicrobiota bacterium]
MNLDRLPQLLAASCLLAAPAAFAANEIPAGHRIGPFAIGVQAYTFNRFSAFEAIEKTEAAGGKVIEFYPGQRLSKEEPMVKWGHDASDEVIARVKEKLARHKIRAVNYGVVAIPTDEAQARKVFEFAKKMELYAITTESDGSIDMIEKLVKEFDIRVGFHEHAKRANNPNYKLWDPNYVLGLVKDRDARIGACADTGHWVTSGLQPVDCLRILKGRIISLHLKERSEIGKQLPDTIFGTGVSNIKGILDELRAQNFKGNISIEYENNWDNSVPDVAQCIGFVRGYLAMLPAK